MIMKAVTSLPSESLRVEADFLQAQADLIREVGNDVHFAASIIGHRAYDYETRAAYLRQAVWNMRSTDDADISKSKESVEQFRRANLVANAAELMGAVQHVKIGLQNVIEIAYRSGLLEDNHNDMVDIFVKEAKPIKQEHEEKSMAFPGAPATFDSLTGSNTGYSLPTSFLAVQGSASYAAALGTAVQPQPPATVLAKTTPSDDVSMDLDGDQSLRKPRSVNMTSYCDMEGVEATMSDGVDCQSSTQPKEEEMLEWIPSDLGLSRRRIHKAADGVYQSLMVREQERERRERAF